MSLGQNIAAERKKQGFSQEDIAALVGVSRQAVSKWEKGQSSPGTDNMIRLAEVLGVSLDDLMEGKQSEENRDRLTGRRMIYRISDSRFLKLLVADRLWTRLFNPLLIIVYLEMWEVMYRLAYVGMLSKNLPWFILCIIVILAVFIECAVSVIVSAVRKPVRAGEYLEIMEKSIVVFDMSYRKKADIQWQEVRRIKENTKYYFLIMDGRRFLPLRKKDIPESQTDLIKKSGKKIRRIRFRIAVSVVWIFITFCGAFAVGSCAVNFGGKLAYKINDLKTIRKVRLRETNYYELRLEGVMKAVESKVDMMPHLMTDQLDIIFEDDGELESIDAYIYGYDEDYKLRAGYLLYYDVKKGNTLSISIQDYDGVDKSGQKEYDPNNDMRILRLMERSVNIRGVVGTWHESRYGVYYKGIASWGYDAVMGGLFYIDESGEIRPELDPTAEVTGPSMSVYCAGKVKEITPVRFVYSGKLV